MGLLGNILSAPFKIINAPIKAGEKLFDLNKGDLDFTSKPLEALTKELAKI